MTSSDGLEIGVRADRKREGSDPTASPEPDPRYRFPSKKSVSASSAGGTYTISD